MRTLVILLGLLMLVSSVNAGEIFVDGSVSVDKTKVTSQGIEVLDDDFVTIKIEMKIPKLWWMAMRRVTINKEYMTRLRARNKKNLQTADFCYPVYNMSDKAVVKNFTNLITYSDLARLANRFFQSELESSGVEYRDMLRFIQHMQRKYKYKSEYDIILDKLNK